MGYTIYKLTFPRGVHFGNGVLNDTGCAFHSDQLFSALYIEALKCGMETDLYESVKSGKLAFSDAFPFVKDTYLLPKPMLHIEDKRQGDSDEKKKFKKIHYISVEQLDLYLKGQMDPSNNLEGQLGAGSVQVMAAVRNETPDTLPYHLGVYTFYPNCGLYVIVKHTSEDVKHLFDDLMLSLSYAGIGGKRSSGLGRFELFCGELPAILQNHLEKTGKWKMTLSTSLPREEEMEDALQDACYLLEKRSGFVASASYAEEERRKNDLFVMAAGSCFKNSFTGDIYDVSNGGKHPVYRMAVPLFMGV